MRSALLCVFFTLIIHKEIINAQNDDFRPTPIPLNEWRHERREGRAGTLHEKFKTDSTEVVAAIPAHYWEDALRHSVYLTLVRDKIDQLIAKGDVISPNSKPDGYDSKEIDDHDLWDKIKTALFDRIPEEEPTYFSDVTIMAKGRLLEKNGRFHFVEDERTKDKCSGDNCMEGVKAFWSVKRVRQRDQETSNGKYHYELTFSVISHKPKKQRKPYENPIRTFTVKETAPSGVATAQKAQEKVSHVPNHAPRPERAIWFHKNISPARSAFTGRKQYFSGLDSIFSSFFSDDEDKSYESPQSKYKQNSYQPQTGSQYSKIGHVGVPVDHHQIPYAYRPHSLPQARPPLQAPPTNPIQPPYLDIHTTTNNYPYAHYPYDHRLESGQNMKTSRPAVLPTPLPAVSPFRDQSAEVTNIMSVESTANIPEPMNMHKTYNKYKPTPVKVNYFSDHVRPPVYNAPPGVFVTMDKKPFKPLPPLKLHSSKPHRGNKPIDFRPSPQILDHSSEHSFSDNSFRPMTINYNDTKSSESGEIDYTITKVENKYRKTNVSGKKPTKKNQSLKPHRHTSPAPEIITVPSSSEEIESMDWTNVLGAFTKTTPMVSQTEKMHIIPETTTPLTTTSTIAVPKKRTTTTTEKVPETTVTISTTVKPKKRTRPPPKFVKQEKIKKHKRITTTTTSTTTTTNIPESQNKRRQSNDLIPQASSAVTGTMKSFKEHFNTLSTSTSSTSTSTTTTKPTTTTTTSTTTMTTSIPSTSKKPVSSIYELKNKNRFRQSTLMYKGTSVKHDRWSAVNMQKNQTTTPNPSSFLHRRKGSNFQGYVPSTTPRQIKEERAREKILHADHKLNAESTESPEMTSQTNSIYEETVDQYESNSVLPVRLNNEGKNYEDESKDHTEYIFQETTTPMSHKQEEASVQVDQSPNAPSKNKTKCIKKKSNYHTMEDSTDIEIDNFATTPHSSPSTPETRTSDASRILEKIFNFDFSDDDEITNLKSESELDEGESLNHESYLKINSAVNEFSGVLKGEKPHKEEQDDQDQFGNESDEDEDNDDDDDDDDDDIDNEEYEWGDDNDTALEDEEFEKRKIPSIEDDNFGSEEEKKETSRQTNPDNKDKKRPYSFLELMAMS